MSHRTRASGKATALAIAVALSMSVSANSAQTITNIDLPAQPLAQAIQVIARQASINILVDPRLVEGRNAPAVKAQISIEQALNLLLQGTGLTPRYVDGKTITLVAVDAPVKTSAHRSTTASAVRLAQSDVPSSSQAEGQGEDPEQEAADQKDQGRSQERVEASHRIEEIIVTAQKREEKLHDVPVPVTVISGQSLVQQNQLRIADYYTSIPGLDVSSNGVDSGVSTFAIRGITTGGAGNPTVGTAIDDIPLGASTIYGGGYFAPDIDPGDLERIEILRGPQGTLYGANSMGGLLKYVTIDPSTDRSSGRVEAGLDSIRNGDGLGYNARAAVNVPVTDAFAFRASGFSRTTAGYIDNVTPQVSGVNEERVEGGRLSALAQLADGVNLKLSALLQNTTLHGSSYVDIQPGLGDLQQAYARGVGGNEQEYRIYSATLTARLGGADLTALSSYRTFDMSGPIIAGSLSQQLAQDEFNVSSAAVLVDLRTRKFSQELRLVTPIGEKLEWLLGGLYTRESSANTQRGAALNPVTGEQAGELFDIRFPTTYEEYAGFTDLTYKVTERFDVQLGVRASKGKQTYQETDAGLLFDFIFGTPNTVLVGPTLRSSDTATTYLFTPRFRVSPNLMTYARVASGYRPGGANSTGDTGLPKQFDPDKTQNYEIGVKGDFFDRTLSFDTSLYYIDWKDIQLFLVSPGGFGYFTNGSRAKSQGVELSVESRPRKGTTIGAWIALTEVELTEAFPPLCSPTVTTTCALVQGPKGARLPGSTRVSGHISLHQEFSLTDAVTGYIGGGLSYVGDRQGSFTASGEREKFPSYTKIDLNAGARYESWTVNVYVNNLADKRGVVAGGLGSLDPNGFILIQPRMVGMSLSKTFD